MRHCTYQGRGDGGASTVYRPFPLNVYFHTHADMRTHTKDTDVLVSIEVFKIPLDGDDQTFFNSHTFSTAFVWEIMTYKHFNTIE